MNSLIQSNPIVKLLLGTLFMHVLSRNVEATKEEFHHLCPPNTVASPEEINHYCHYGNSGHFGIHDGEYRCYFGDSIHPKCRGAVDKDKELPTCSQPTIANCEDEALYNNFSNESKGPCLYRSVDVIRHSAKCGDGEYSCFDPSLNVWCSGKVENSDLQGSASVTCPPSRVYSIQEAVHYCKKSGLVGRVDPEDDERYACYHKDDSIACEGKIDGRRPPSCSSKIHTCEDLSKVCDTATSSALACDEVTRSFECWDLHLDRWCLGSFMKPYHPHDDVHSRQSIREGQSTITSDHDPASNGERQRFPLLITLLGVVGIAGVVMYKKRVDSAAKIQDMASSFPSHFGYHLVVGNGRDPDLELSYVVQ